MKAVAAHICVNSRCGTFSATASALLCAHRTRDNAASARQNRALSVGRTCGRMKSRNIVAVASWCDAGSKQGMEEERP
jgi:hypothetical protein